MDILKHEMEEVQLHGGLTTIERYTRVVVLQPRKLCAIYSIILLGISAFILIGGYFEIQNTSSKDWIVATSDASQDADSLEEALKLIDAVTAQPLEPRSQPSAYMGVNIIYEWSDSRRKDMIITAENLQRFCTFQRLFTGLPDYPTFCVTDFADGLNTNCSDQLTDIVHYYYPAIQDRVDCPLLNSTKFDDIYSTEFAASPAVNYFYDKNFYPPQSNVTYVTRATIQLGAPLGTDSTPNGKSYSFIQEDNDDPQYDIYSVFMEEFEQAVFREFNLDDSNIFRSPYLVSRLQLGGGIQARYEYLYFRDHEFYATVEADQLFIVAAVFFVGLCMFIHMQSIFLAICGILTVVLSFPIATFIFRFLCGIDYLTDVTMVAIFLILGVGADNIFVVVDAFKQSSILWVSLRGIKDREEAGEKNVYGTGDPDTEVLIARLAYAYRRASASIFNTSFTTAAAFLATGTSPVTPVAGFGFFSAITILVNYLFVLTIIANLVLIHHLYFDNSKVDKCRCCRKVENANENSDEYKASFEDRIFTRGYIPMMTFKFNSIPIVAIISILSLLVLFLTMAFFTSKLAAPTQQEEQFQDDHMITGFLQDNSDLFLGGAATEFMTVKLFWGIKGIDRSKFKRFEPRGERGDPLFDEEFEIHTETSQQHVLDTCAALRTYECKTSNGKVPKGCTQATMTFPGELDCFMERFHNWHDTSFANTTNFTEAITLGDVDKDLWTSRLSNFTTLFEYTDRIGFINGEIKFVVVSYVATMKLYRPSTIKQDFFIVMDEFIEDTIATAPVGMRSIKQTSFDLQWITLELGIIDGMFQGLTISFPIAYLVLLLATGNVILATFAILSIAGIVSTVLGCTYLLGWSLGIAESISAVIVIGLAVDYTIHLGHMYQVAGKENIDSREGKFRFSAERMGPTVLAGSITTAGSSAVMFACQLTVFNKMATLIVLTIVCSIFYALFWFLPFCYLCGPEGNWGQWTVLFRYCNLKTTQEQVISKEPTSKNLSL